MLNAAVGVAPSNAALGLMRFSTPDGVNSEPAAEGVSSAADGVNAGLAEFGWAECAGTT